MPVRQPEPPPVDNSPTYPECDKQMLVVRATPIMLDVWNQTEHHSDLAEETHDVAVAHVAREFETFRKLFETFPSTIAEAAALFERFAQPLYGDDDFTVIEHAIELWKGGGGQLPAAKEWSSRMAAALNLIAGGRSV
jgi:hypothetical protein